MIYRVLNLALQGFWYALAVAGFLILFRSLRQDTIERLRRMYYGFGHRQLLRVHGGFQKRTLPDREQETWLHGLNHHLETLIYTVRKRPKDPVVPRFLITSGSIGGLTFLFCLVGVQSFAFALMAGLLVTGLPYLWLQVRRYQIGVQNSYEISTLLDTLLAEYRKHDHSMMHALEATVKILPDRPIRRALFRLTDRLANYTTPEEARRALRRFSEEMSTTWALQLANDLEHAFLDQLDVEMSLAMTRKELQFIEDARKDEKWVSSDNLLIAIVPFLLWPLILAILQLKLSHHILYDQFATREGLRWFVLTLFATLGSFAIGIIFFRPKQDL